MLKRTSSFGSEELIEIESILKSVMAIKSVMSDDRQTLDLLPSLSTFGVLGVS